MPEAGERPAGPGARGPPGVQVQVWAVPPPGAPRGPVAVRVPAEHLPPAPGHGPSAREAAPALRRAVLRALGVPAAAAAGARVRVSSAAAAGSADLRRVEVAVGGGLRGGKGGFGAQLRAGGRGPQQVTNQDACRDLQGRRLRQVNAEKELQEWEAGQHGRDLEAVAERHLKERAKEAAAAQVDHAALAKYRAELRGTSAAVAAAVQDGLGQKGKRPAAPPPGARPAKRGKNFFSALSDSDSDSEAEAAAEAAGAAGAAGAAPRGGPAAEPSRRAEAEEKPVEVPNEKPVEVPEEEVPAFDLAACLDGAQKAEDLEALGLDALKRELMQRGLKCGGDLRARAQRLFLLKATPLAALDRKHFAKPKPAAA